MHAVTIICLITAASAIPFISTEAPRLRRDLKARQNDSNVEHIENSGVLSGILSGLDIALPINVPVDVPVNVPVNVPVDITLKEKREPKADN